MEKAVGGEERGWGRRMAGDIPGEGKGEKRGGTRQWTGKRKRGGER